MCSASKCFPSNCIKILEHGMQSRAESTKIIEQMQKGQQENHKEQSTECRRRKKVFAKDKSTKDATPRRQTITVAFHRFHLFVFSRRKPPRRTLCLGSRTPNGAEFAAHGGGAGRIVFSLSKRSDRFWEMKGAPREIAHLGLQVDEHRKNLREIVSADAGAFAI